MSGKPSRPPMFDLNALIVKPQSAAPAVVVEIAEEIAEASPQTQVKAKGRVASKPKVVAPVETAMFRTSVYFALPVHDKLREIAFEERKTVTDLINEGLDHVLRTRNYPATAELRGKKS